MYHIMIHDREWVTQPLENCLFSIVINPKFTSTNVINMYSKVPIIKPIINTPNKHKPTYVAGRVRKTVLCTQVHTYPIIGSSTFYQ